MDELLEQFLIEGPEQVQHAGEALLALEGRPDDAALVDQAFRAIHTLKGSVGLFDLPAMGQVLHVAEDLLGAWRDGRRALSRGAVDALIAATGQTERWLGVLAATGGGLPADADAVAADLVSRLNRALDGDAPPSAPIQATDIDTAWIEALFRDRDLAPARHPRVTALRYVPDAGCYFRGDDPVAFARAVPDLLALRITRRDVAAPVAADAYDPYACDLVVELLSAAAPEVVKGPFRFVPDQIQLLSWSPPPSPSAPVPPPALAEGPRSLRVEASRIDALAQLVDELVVAKNALSDLAGQMADGLAPQAAAQILGDRQAALDRLVARLHRTVMGIRLVPILPLLRRFPRVVRETATALGKEVDLAVDGQDVQVDKAIVEGLFEPLTHLLRNAVDHGIEPAAERAAAGKPARALISLVARREGDHVVIDVADDGRGMDPVRIRRAAAARGLLPDRMLDALADDQVLDLVFRPGFSTAEAVTDLSGRGVGMDAVRAAVGRLGGSVGISSASGQGTTVRLVLPLNLVLTKVMIVTVAGERYGIPMDGIVETARVDPDRVFPIRAGRAFVLRDTAVPLLSLAALLGLPEEARADGGPCRAVVARMGGELVAVEVGAFVGRRDVVLRPLTGLLSAMPGVLGTTLLGDGHVLMILDVPGLIAAAPSDTAPVGQGAP
ncbi:chemotaxis protein CheA [Nitrospirillum viridazoti]|uniref:Chemotaxis protein CheA n=1 Tax=Nitrospirillum viridazoti CBAmc TaxID=1441467 RepID=A0A248JVM8_9PROT|nr:chemotaxis protein CheA [Nitrospirillum amazonense]ASG22755.1 chemotaxis protein CheA [Nitrospirillum amazonense CBAmc]TWB33792.1 two-component system chemotaxis sensor kinase CheA [Nitrospirillum amazonense]